MPYEALDVPSTRLTSGRLEPMALPASSISSSKSGSGNYQVELYFAPSDASGDVLSSSSEKGTAIRPHAHGHADTRYILSELRAHKNPTLADIRRWARDVNVPAVDVFKAWEEEHPDGDVASKAGSVPLPTALLGTFDIGVESENMWYGAPYDARNGRAGSGVLPAYAQVGGWVPPESGDVERSHMHKYESQPDRAVFVTMSDYYGDIDTYALSGYDDPCETTRIPFPDFPPPPPPHYSAT
ncbi:hypothetical protein C8Q77DRAFT_1161241 [Trametes polyzona]|nr:hypothetical protein C8Q77DRAFT_1161241 [Trametes polyzona]